MIVVLSDLHFTEAQSTRIGGFQYNRNIPYETFWGFFTEINNFALANGIRSLDMVLAGDILEINRSGIWFEGPDRPYIDCQDVHSKSSTEATLLKIIDAISQEENVRETLALFRNLKDQFDIPFRLHYLLGNHDRLLNATPAIRAKARALFGLDQDDSFFKRHLIFYQQDGKPFCLIRHGHIYDPINFSLRIDEMDEIPTEFPDDVYDHACLGDITTVEFGAALPHAFKETYGETEILKNKHLSALYQRLIEFDDVRPTQALLSYLFSTPGVKKRETWMLMKPCFVTIFQSLQNNHQFTKEISKLTVLPAWKKLLVMGLLNIGGMIRFVPYWVVKRLIKMVSKQIKRKSPVKWVKREALLSDTNSGLRCVISGHTHTPEVTLISAKHGEDRFYINTGTWRNKIPATKNFEKFSRVKSITKLIIFQPNENPDQSKTSDWSFHYLSGESYGNYNYQYDPGLRNKFAIPSENLQSISEISGINLQKAAGHLP
jgi:UDP-2,3-diacylglucosamine pyrophosphatase LpxH